MKKDEKSKGKNPALLILLLLIILGVAYYMLFYTPNKEAVAAAISEQRSIQNDLDQIQREIQGFESTQTEVDRLIAESNGTRLYSYNNIKAELSELNSILSTTKSYSINFSSPTLDGMLVRRNIQLQFRTATYADAKAIVSQLTNSQYRCLLGDLSFSTEKNGGETSISVTATYFETMYEGTPDSGLPAA